MNSRKFERTLVLSALILGILYAGFICYACSRQIRYDREAVIRSQAAAALETKDEPAPELPEWVGFYTQGLKEVQQRYNQGLYQVWDDYDRRWKLAFGDMFDINDVNEQNQKQKSRKEDEQ